jgi:hypothetical protein
VNNTYKVKAKLSFTCKFLGSLDMEAFGNSLLLKMEKKYI